jgi:glycosyltransferase involved in cell wall biosynthesis
MQLIYFSPVFARSYAQRPHFTAQAWLDLGAEAILWVEPYPARLPQWSDLLRRHGLHDQKTAMSPRISVLSVPAIPIEPLPGGTWLNRRFAWTNVWRELTDFAAAGPTVLGIGRPGALALMALRELPLDGSFYEAMDDFPEFYRGLSRRAMRQHEDAIAAGVDLIVASSTALTAKFTKASPGREAGDAMHAAQTPSRGLRPGLAAVAKVLNACTHPSLPVAPPHVGDQPVLGYVGCLGKWFHWPLVLRLAETVPHCRIELVGPCAVRPPRRLPPNVRLLPPCKQDEVESHLARFSAGLIPFRRTPLTAGVDPVKYHEYRAAGLPVLSTTFGEMALRSEKDGVYFLDQSRDLAAVVDRALRHPFDAAAVETFRRENTWQARYRAADPFRSLLARAALRPAA